MKKRKDIKFQDHPKAYECFGKERKLLFLRDKLFDYTNMQLMYYILFYVPYNLPYFLISYMINCANKGGIWVVVN